MELAFGYINSKDKALVLPCLSFILAVRSALRETLDALNGPTATGNLGLVSWFRQRLILSRKPWVPNWVQYGSCVFQIGSQ